MCVVRYKDKRTQAYEYVAFATTDLSLSAKQGIKTYPVRPEIQEDYRPLKGSRWRVDCFHATPLVQIIWHVILTLLAYNPFEVYANTDPGRRFAQQTKAKLEREQGRNPPTSLLVCTHEAFGVYETKALLYVLLKLPEHVRNRIAALLPNQLQ